MMASLASERWPGFAGMRSYRLLRGIYPVFRVLLPNQVIRADDLAHAMVDVALRERGEQGGVVLENRDIRAMVDA
jgi:hypothetical protein